MYKKLSGEIGFKAEEVDIALKSIKDEISEWLKKEMIEKKYRLIIKLSLDDKFNFYPPKPKNAQSD